MVEKQKEFNDGKEASKSEDAPEEGEATKEKNSGLLGLPPLGWDVLRMGFCPPAE